MKKTAFGIIVVLALASASFAPVTAATDAPLLVPGYPAARDVAGAKELPDPHMDYKVVFADGQEAKSKSDINPMLPSIAQYLNTLGKYGVPAAHRHIVIMFHQRNPDMDIVMTNEAYKARFGNILEQAGGGTLSDAQIEKQLLGAQKEADALLAQGTG